MVAGRLAHLAIRPTHSAFFVLKLLTAAATLTDSRRMGREFVGVYRLDSADFPLLADYDPDERLARAVATVQALVNNPDILAERARQLRDGTAKPIDGLA